MIWSLNSLIPEILERIFKPKPTLNVWQWAEKNVYLDERSTATPGFYDSSLTPWTRRMQETPHDPSVDEYLVMKSSRTGFTEGGLNIIRYMPENWPGNAIYSIDSKNEAKNISKDRLRPTLRSVAASSLTEDNDDFGIYTIFLKVMTIFLLGSYSPGAFANKWARVVELDEVEEHGANEGEISTIDLGRSRLTTADDSKLYVMSKPKKANTIFHKEWKTGTCEYYFVPCPHCNHKQRLVWEGIRFNHCKDLAGEWDLKRVEQDTYYECECCHQRIDEHHKRQMNLEGEWRATNPKAKPGKISCQISDLYSLFPKVSWGRLALIWLDSQNSITKLQHFFNNHLGLPWEDQGAEVTETDVEKCRSPYLLKNCPINPCLVTMTVDVQGDVLKYAKGAWNNKGDLYIIDYGYVLDPSELILIANDPIPIVGTDEYVTVKLGLVDSGYRTTEVYDLCVKSKGVFFPSKGRGGIQVRQPIYQSQVEHGINIKLPIYLYNDDEFKRQLYIDRIGKIQEVLDGKRKSPRIYLPEDIGKDFISELAGEKLVKETDKRGNTKILWVKVSTNDFGDCVKEQLVIWQFLASILQGDNETHS